MNICSITWTGDSIDDVEILPQLPTELASLLAASNGFIVHRGALHVRGAVSGPGWHSLRDAWQGPNAFSTLYPDVRATDIPFAQDQVGDQFLLRDDVVYRLCGETGDITTMAVGLLDFLRRVDEDAEEFLNVGLDHELEPGELLLAYPPFVFKEAKDGVAFRKVKADEVIQFHAQIARQIREIPDGGQVRISISNLEQ